MAPIFMRDIQRTLLWSPKNPLFGLPLRGFHPLWHTVPGDFELANEAVNGSKLHISLTFLQGFGLPYAVFDRLY